MHSIPVCGKSLPLHFIMTLAICSYFPHAWEKKKTNNAAYLEIMWIFVAPGQPEAYPDLKAL